MRKFESIRKSWNDYASSDQIIFYPLSVIITGLLTLLIADKPETVFVSAAVIFAAFFLGFVIYLLNPWRDKSTPGKYGKGGEQ